MNTVTKSLKSIGRKSLVIEILKHWEKKTLKGWISYVGDFPVNRFPSPASEEAKRMIVSSGQKCLEFCESLILDTSLLKMFLEFPPISMKFLGAWRLKVTNLLHLRCQLLLLVPRTVEGASLFLPTPTASDAKTHRNDIIRYDSLTAYLHRKDGLGFVNPEYLEHLMGFPLGWTDLEH